MLIGGLGKGLVLRICAGHTKSSENGVFGIYASWLDSSCSMHVDSVIVLVSSGGNL